MSGMFRRNSPSDFGLHNLGPAYRDNQAFRIFRVNPAKQALTRIFTPVSTGLAVEICVFEQAHRSVVQYNEGLQADIAGPR